MVKPTKFGIQFKPTISGNSESSDARSICDEFQQPGENPVQESMCQLRRQYKSRESNTNNSTEEFKDRQMTLGQLINSQDAHQILQSLQLTARNSSELIKCKIMRTASPQMNNFHENFLKFGLWPELSFQKQQELRNEYRTRQS